MKHLANNKAFENCTSLPRQTRLSTGTAIVLGLLKGKIDVAPTTAYLMTYSDSKCNANCAFCPQARKSASNAELLSRVAWPVFATEIVLQQLEKAISAGEIKRVCIQALNYPSVFSEVCSIVETLKKHVNVPVSVSCQPLNSQNIWFLAEAGVDRIGIALDAATENLFEKAKGHTAGGPYRWRDVHKLLRVALGIFGEGNVSTHLIVGLGETEKETITTVQECVDMGVLPALFAFTPIKGTAMASLPKPEIGVYRRIQLARYLVVNGQATVKDMRFDSRGRIVDFGISHSTLSYIVETGLPFLTSGCPSCNRPFYNEKPGGPLYNYPRNIRLEELKTIKREVKF